MPQGAALVIYALELAVGPPRHARLLAEGLESREADAISESHSWNHIWNIGYNLVGAVAVIMRVSVPCSCSLLWKVDQVLDVCPQIARLLEGLLP